MKYHHHYHSQNKGSCSQFSSVQFSSSVMSDSLRPHGLQYARPPYPSPTPGVYSNSCPLSLWCHPTISSSVVPFSFHLQSFPEGLIFFRMDWLDLLAVQGTVKNLLQHHNLKASILWCSAFFMVQLLHLYMTWKPQLWLYGPLSAKWCLCFLMCCLGLL